MDHLVNLVKRINRNGDFYDEETPTPLLTLDEFFTGNNVVGSIGCNLESEPHPSELESVLRTIEEQENTERVYIQVTEMDDPDWPFSDTAWIVTTGSMEQVRSGFPSSLAPDEIWEGFLEDQIYEQNFHNALLIHLLYKNHQDIFQPDQNLEERLAC